MRVNLFFTKTLMVFALMFMFIVAAYPQGLQDILDSIGGSTNITELLGVEMVLTAFIINAIGYLQPLLSKVSFLNFLYKWTDTTWRIFVLALLLIIGLVNWGVVDIWQGALSYLLSTSLYELVWSRLLKTKAIAPS